MLYAFFWVIPRRLNSNTGELPRRKHKIKKLCLTLHIVVSWVTIFFFVDNAVRVPQLYMLQNDCFNLGQGTKWCSDIFDSSATFFPLSLGLQYQDQPGPVFFGSRWHCHKKKIVYPCIVSIIVIDDLQDANILVYLFFPNQLYMFRAMFCQSSGALDCIYIFWYRPMVLLLAGVMDEMERSSMPFHLIHDISQQQ